MDIAILGGTGKEGAGLGARWALAGHAILIGSRDPERAAAKAAELRERTGKPSISGHGNAEAARAYLAWEVDLVARLDDQERGVFRVAGH